MYVNLFYFLKKGKKPIYRASKMYSSFEEALSFKDIAPDAGWIYIGTVSSFAVPIQTNFVLVESEDGYIFSGPLSTNQN